MSNFANHSNEYTSHVNDNNNDTYAAYSDSKMQIHNNSNKINRNDSNNNANEVYNYHQTSYSEDDLADDKTKLGFNNNSDDYYKNYEENEKDDRRYEEEFDNEYAKNSHTTSKQLMQKQMSVQSDDAHGSQDDFMNDRNKRMLNSEQNTIDEDYLEFDDDQMLRRKSDGLKKKQESILDDDLELKHLEQNQHQQQFQNIDNGNELDQFDIEMQQKKSVISDEEVIVVHEKPREKRTAKQRWHWAYNRIVHQAQVSLSQNYETIFNTKKL